MPDGVHPRSAKLGPPLNSHGIHIFAEFQIAENKQVTFVTQVSQERGPIVVLEKQCRKLLPKSILLVSRECDGIGPRQQLDFVGEMSTEISRSVASVAPARRPNG
jgi:hypothetical protein